MANEPDDTSQLEAMGDGELAVTVLRDVAINAHKKDWGFCPKCRSRVQADKPDLGARVQAARALAGGSEDKPLDPHLDPAKMTEAQRAQLRLRIEALLQQHETALSQSAVTS